MKVKVLGPGSMGLLYGAKLSKEADVCLIGRNEENIRAINECGVTIKRGGHARGGPAGQKSPGAGDDGESRACDGMIAAIIIDTETKNGTCYLTHWNSWCFFL